MSLQSKCSVDPLLDSPVHGHTASLLNADLLFQGGAPLFLNMPRPRPSVLFFGGLT